MPQLKDVYKNDFVKGTNIFTLTLTLTCRVLLQGWKDQTGSMIVSPSPGARKRFASSPCCRVYRS